jgi:hypothetical protein
MFNSFLYRLSDYAQVLEKLANSLLRSGQINLLYIVFRVVFREADHPVASKIYTILENFVVESDQDLALGVLNMCFK